MRRSIAPFLAALLLVLSAQAALATAPTQRKAPVLPATAHPLGVTYETWAARWIEWAFGTAVADNPLAHPDSCTTNLHGKVWFMPQTAFGNSAETSCSVGTGTWILMSPGGAFCAEQTDNIVGRAALTACAEGALAPIGNAVAMIDGRPVSDLSRYRVTSAFDLTLPEDNLFGIGAGTSPAVAIGWFVMVHPLAPGEHTLVVHDEMGGSVAQVTVHLTVTPGR